MLDIALKQYISDWLQKVEAFYLWEQRRQAQQSIAEAASKCAQYYINYRWLGGTLTNWNTVSNSILRLKDLEI